MQPECVVEVDSTGQKRKRWKGPVFQNPLEGHSPNDLMSTFHTAVSTPSNRVTGWWPGLQSIGLRGPQQVRSMVQCAHGAQQWANCGPSRAETTLPHPPLPRDALLEACLPHLMIKESSKASCVPWTPEPPPMSPHSSQWGSKAIHTQWLTFLSRHMWKWIPFCSLESAMQAEALGCLLHVFFSWLPSVLAFQSSFLICWFLPFGKRPQSVAHRSGFHLRHWSPGGQYSV